MVDWSGEERREGEREPRNCGDTCDEHGILANDVKWIRNLMVGGFTLVLSAVVYFNIALTEGIKEIHDEVVATNSAFLKKSMEHDFDVASLANKVGALEAVCCDR